MEQEYKKMAITQWAVEDRPREKLLLKGIESLSDAELIAILIGSGNRDESAVELSKRILNSADNNLHELGRYSIKSLIDNFKGIGEAKAISIVAAMELGKRRKVSDIIKRQQITSSSDAAEIFQSILCDLPHEEFWILILNQSNKIVARQRLSIGGVTGTVVDTKIIIKHAVEKMATGLILSHNHPSGNKKPSKSDIDITTKVKNACSFFDINLLDHIIVTNKDYFSFADEGYLS